MRHARMLGLALEDRLQDRRTLELIGIGLVGGRGRRVERQARSGSAPRHRSRIALRQLLHGVGVGEKTRAVVDFFVVGIHDAKRLQI